MAKKRLLPEIMNKGQSPGMAKNGHRQVWQIRDNRQRRQTKTIPGSGEKRALPGMANKRLLPKKAKKDQKAKNDNRRVKAKIHKWRTSFWNVGANSVQTNTFEYFSKIKCCETGESTMDGCP